MLILNFFSISLSWLPRNGAFLRARLPFLQHCRGTYAVRGLVGVCVCKCLVSACAIVICVSNEKRNFAFRNGRTSSQESVVCINSRRSVCVITKLNNYFSVAAAMANVNKQVKIKHYKIQTLSFFGGLLCTLRWLCMEFNSYLRDFCRLWNPKWHRILY